MPVQEPPVQVNDAIKGRSRHEALPEHGSNNRISFKAAWYKDHAAFNATLPQSIKVRHVMDTKHRKPFGYAQQCYRTTA